MSMLSAQCDELRERAKVLRQGRWSDGADDARLMEDAADTIWELRGSVHRERAEADRLREQGERLFDKTLELGTENAKLRELVHRLISHVEHPPCEGCMAEMNCDGEQVTQCDEWLFMVADARKLGVEV